MRDGFKERSFCCALNADFEVRKNIVYKSIYVNICNLLPVDKNKVFSSKLNVYIHSNVFLLRLSIAVSIAAIYTSVIYLNRFHGSTIPVIIPQARAATPAIIHSTQSHTPLRYHSFDHRSINQSPPNPFAKSPHPSIPRLLRITPLFPKIPSPTTKYENWRRKARFETGGSGRG